MRKKFNGFTLVECIVALAILGIGSLIMAQIYANVCRINLNNHRVNTSLAYQMKLVEEQTNADRVEIYYNDSNTADPNSKDSDTAKKPPHEQGNDRCVSIVSNYTNNEFSYPVDIFVLLSRSEVTVEETDASGLTTIKTKSVASSDSDYNGPDEGDYNLRYKYIMGHSN